MTTRAGKAGREPSPCDFCDDPHCLDDFITGECPVEESEEDCGCIYLVDKDFQMEVARIFTCKMHLEMEKDDDKPDSLQGD